MLSLDKLNGVFASFSCVVFELNYAKTDLISCVAVHGASEGWDYMRKNPGQVYVDIERRGDDWHVDVITRAYGAGRYDCWFSSRFASLEQARLAAMWLAMEDWKVLRDKTPERNTARRLTEGEQAQLESFAPFAKVPSIGTPVRNDPSLPMGEHGNVRVD
jgi:hypothetical protein